MKKLFYLFVLILIPFFFTACEKDDFNNNIITEQITDDIILLVDNVIIATDKISDSKGETVLANTCPIIRVHHPDTALFPRTIVINFGTNCRDSIGNVRTGRIITVVSAPRNLVGTKISTRFDKYSYNGIKFEGGKQMIVKKVTDTQITLLVRFKIKLTFPDGRIVQRIGETIKIVKK
jgi:hypothetical protein